MTVDILSLVSIIIIIIIIAVVYLSATFGLKYEDGYEDDF